MEVTKCKKCGRIIAEPKELIRIQKKGGVVVVELGQIHTTIYIAEYNFVGNRYLYYFTAYNYRSILEAWTVSAVLCFKLRLLGLVA